METKSSNLPGFKSAYDKEDDGDVILKNERSPRPKDAATLILVRPGDKQVEVLMGKRSSRHAFMPDKYVFPGGRVDPPDGRVPAATELHPRSAAQLTRYARRKPRAFALTAIRETFEETGLIVGKPCDISAARRVPADWESFFQQDAQPSLAGLRFVGRAITPPYRPKRFDARFFMADARDALIDNRPPIDGAELSDLQWITIKDAMDLDLPSVTRFMLGEVAERASNPGTQPHPPFLRWTVSGHKMERL
ncbi:MAG: NUDIX hydrolase [Pseudomonadota bacterium]